jgi:hypothetical protein
VQGTRAQAIALIAEQAWPVQPPGAACQLVGHAGGPAARGEHACAHAGDPASGGRCSRNRCRCRRRPCSSPRCASPGRAGSRGRRTRADCCPGAAAALPSSRYGRLAPGRGRHGADQVCPPRPVDSGGRCDRERRAFQQACRSHDAPAAPRPLATCPPGHRRRSCPRGLPASAGSPEGSMAHTALLAGAGPRASQAARTCPGMARRCRTPSATCPPPVAAPQAGPAARTAARCAHRREGGWPQLGGQPCVIPVRGDTRHCACQPGHVRARGIPQEPATQAAPKTREQLTAHAHVEAQSVRRRDVCRLRRSGT